MAKCINDVLMSFIKNPPFDIIIFSNYIVSVYLKMFTVHTFEIMFHLCIEALNHEPYI